MVFGALKSVLMNEGHFDKFGMQIEKETFEKRLKAVTKDKGG